MSAAIPFKSRTLYVPRPNPFRMEIAMRPDVEAMKADIEQSVALLRRRL